MSHPKIFYKWFDFESLGSVNLYQVLKLRQSIFVVEQKCPYLDIDSRDQAAMHLCAFHDQSIVAYLRTLRNPSATNTTNIGRILVDRNFRGQRIGRNLVKQALKQLLDANKEEKIEISAQEHLQHYYASLGFEKTGGAYDEDGIMHLPMRYVGSC